MVFIVVLIIIIIIIITRGRSGWLAWGIGGNEARGEKVLDVVFAEDGAV